MPNGPAVDGVVKLNITISKQRLVAVKIGIIYFSIIKNNYTITRHFLIYPSDRSNIEITSYAQKYIYGV